MALSASPPSSARPSPSRFSLRRAWPFALACALIVAACAQAPGTGRSQIILLSNEEVAPMGLQAFQEVKANERVVTGTQNSRLIEEIGRRILQAADAQLDPQGFRDDGWEFALLDNPQRNAFALPGGRVAFYTGILPICETPEGIATVMGHEIAHVFNRHGAEKMSVNMGAQMLQQIVAGVSPSGPEYQLGQQILMAGTQYGVVLRNGRTQEYEADRNGLFLMAAAGYDPRAAPELWQRMAAAGGGSQQPEWLSTHPLSENRAARLRELMPEALRLYENAKSGGER